MITVVKLFYIQKWKDLTLATTEEYLIKMMEFAEVTKFTSLTKEKTTSVFMADQKSLIDFLHRMEKSAVMI